MGYEALFQATQTLLKDITTAPQTLGFLLSLALHNFSISSIFSTLQSADISQIDTNMADIGPHLNTICQPGAIKALWDALAHLPAGCSTLRYAVFKIFERLLYLNHRNQIVFSSLDIVKSIFDAFIAARKNPASDEKERHVLQRILRRTLDLGATTGFSRLILQKTIKDDNGLDADVLDVVRAGMKARWPEHFSLESPAAIVMAQENTRGLPVTGFTFMVRCPVENLSAVIHSMISDMVMGRDASCRCDAESVFFRHASENNLRLEPHFRRKAQVAEHGQQWPGCFS